MDRASAVFDAIVRGEREKGKGAGDHFAKPGANDCIWHAVETHCLVKANSPTSTPVRMLINIHAGFGVGRFSPPSVPD